MKRTTKRYVVNTSALNCYLFRILTEGIDISHYANNPIMLWMHLRATGNEKNQILPLGRCTELQFEGDKLTCYLEFDETDDFAMQIYNKFENGTLNMLSIGAKPLEFSEEPEMMLTGQFGPTVTKSLLVEVSCVDIGGNPEAHACQLYDADDNKIEMASLDPANMIKLFNPLQKTTDENMKLLQLSAPVAGAIMLALKLQETATEADVQKAVADLVQLNANQTNEIATLTAAKATAETSLANLQKEQNEAKVIALVNTAIDPAKPKALPEQKENLLRLARADYEGTKAMIEAMPVLVNVATKLAANAAKGAGDRVAELFQLSYDELFRNGGLAELKRLDPEQYKAKLEEKFPKGVTKK